MQAPRACMPPGKHAYPLQGSMQAPRACMPPGKHAYPLQESMHAPRKHAPPGEACMSPGKHVYTPLNRITHACKNITFPQLRCGNKDEFYYPPMTLRELMCLVVSGHQSIIAVHRGDPCTRSQPLHLILFTLTVGKLAVQSKCFLFSHSCLHKEMLDI